MNSRSIIVFIPAYRCAPQIRRVLASFTPEIAARFAEILVVENRSPDNTLAAAQEGLVAIAERMAAAGKTGCKVTLLQNDANYSLGGSHKVAFNYCLDHGHDTLVVLHGDDQGSIADALPLLDAGEDRQHACLLGSRFAEGSRLVGYSWFRTFGNRVFNALISLVTRTKVTDMGAGLNIYSREFLASRFYMPFPDNLTFNVYMLYATISQKAKYRFFPLTWREDDQVSNAKMFRQAAQILGLTWRWLTRPERLFSTPAPNLPAAYTSKVILERKAAPDQA